MMDGPIRRFATLPNGLPSCVEQRDRQRTREPLQYNIIKTHCFANHLRNYNARHPYI